MRPARGLCFIVCLITFLIAYTTPLLAAHPAFTSLEWQYVSGKTGSVEASLMVLGDGTAFYRTHADSIEKNISSADLQHLSERIKMPGIFDKLSPCPSLGRAYSTEKLIITLDTERYVMPYYATCALTGVLGRLRTDLDDIRHTYFLDYEE